MGLWPFGKKEDKAPAENAVDLEKKAKERFAVSLEKASDAMETKGLGSQKARVALVLDISMSMRSLFAKGVVQRVCERVLALGVNFDDDGAIDVFLFGEGDYEAPQLHKDDFHDFVAREITPKYSLEGATHYAGVAKRVVDKFVTEPGDPAYVAFITDGDNQDKSVAEKVIRMASDKPVFFQFIGVGHASFNFLHRLDEMDGRVVDNAGFFEVGDIDGMSDEELYDKMLSEFPDWLRAAREKGIIS